MHVMSLLPLYKTVFRLSNLLNANEVTTGMNA